MAKKLMLPGYTETPTVVKNSTIGDNGSFYAKLLKEREQRESN